MLTKTDLEDITNIVSTVVSQAIEGNNRKAIFPKLRQIRKDIKAGINFLDRENLDLQKRVDYIETRLDIVHGN